ncbi:MAG: NAD(P)/FAD-dependent oxidoreductase [Methanobacteriota archaeon]|nr:MAG: NAD(P)/FAD-dependent oxidoreductase [Euryarchaeota archaeon]
MVGRVKVVVVGAGPAGAASAIFLKRAGFEPLVVEERLPGGLLHEADLVENYPGFPEGIAGRDLASLIDAQLNRLEVRVLNDRAVRVTAIGESFRTDTEGGASYASDALVLATGTTPTRAELQGASAIEGRRLFYGVSEIDAELVQGGRAVVLGGGDAAFDYAINLSDQAGSVRIVSRSAPCCLPLLMDRAQDRGVKVETGRVVTKFDMAGDDVIVVCETEDGKDEMALSCDFVVIAYGREPRLEVIDPELGRQISTERPPETGVPGLFAAGDVVRGTNRQASIAVGDGVLAAMLAQRFLSDRGECE